MLRRVLLRLYRLPDRADGSLPADLDLSAEDVEITTQDGARLHGWYIPATGSNGGRRPAVVVMHGWASAGADLLPAAPAVVGAGIPMLMIDARGHGRSDPVDFMSMPRFAEDVDLAVTWLRSRGDVDPERIALIGHSVGAGACLLVASRDPRIAAVVSIASMAHPRELISQSFRRYHVPRPLIRIALRTIEGTIGHAFDDFAPLRSITRIDAPVLVLHGRDDSTVSSVDAARLADAGGPRTTLRIVPGAGHRSLEGFLPVLDEIVGFLRASLRAGRD